MRHGVFGKKLHRTVDERRRLFMILLRSLFGEGKIVTTVAKAQAIRPTAEKLITKAKRGSNADMLQIRKILADRVTVTILMDWAKTRFSKRTSGFTRLVRVGRRLGDASETVELSFVDEAPAKPVVTKAEVVKTAAPKGDVVEAKEVKKPTAKVAKAKKS
jgi:large subunit ribosomal protein L17